MRHVTAAVVVAALTTTACVSRTGSRAPGYALGTLLVITGAAIALSARAEDCDHESLGDSIGCGIGRGMGQALGASMLGAGLISLAVTAGSSLPRPPEPAPPPPQPRPPLPPLPAP